ncbi:MAG TPA: hypothetical protein VF896_01820 [Anaerolineales bacterium]
MKVRLNGPNQVIAQGVPKQAGDVLAVLMSNYPGWKLLIDGQPAQVMPYNGYLGAKRLPGEHSYRFYFMPMQYIIGASISIVTLILIIAMILVSPLRFVLQKLRQTRFPSVYPNPTA